MADYYPLISRAITALDEKSKEARSAVYDRARAALANQLQKANPPLSETDLEHERSALEDAINRVEAGAIPRMNKRLPLPPGTKVIAARDFGPITEGAPGIITGTIDTPFFFWKRRMYLCTFADNVNIAAKPNEIDDFDHQYSLEELEKPRLVLKSPYERS